MTVDKWRKGVGYEDIEGFCKSETVDRIKENGFVLTPSRYVGRVTDKLDEIDFKGKISGLIGELNELKHVAKALDENIDNALSNLSLK